MIFLLIIRNIYYYTLQRIEYCRDVCHFENEKINTIFFKLIDQVNSIRNQLIKFSFLQRVPFNADIVEAFQQNINEARAHQVRRSSRMSTFSLNVFILLKFFMSGVKSDLMDESIFNFILARALLYTFRLNLLDLLDSTVSRSFPLFKLVSSVEV